MKKRKIVHINYSFTIGGTENLLIDLINQQVKNFTVYLIIINKCYNQLLLQQLHPSVKIIFINREPGSREIFKVAKFNFLLAFINPNVIHCHNPNIVRALFVQRKKTVLTVHDVNIESENLHKYGYLVAISTAVKQDILIRNKQCRKVTIVYNGIDFNKIPKKGNNDAVCHFKLLQISRLVHEKKGQDVLLQAVNKLINDLKVSLELHLVGSGKSKTYLEDLIQEYQLQKNVFIHDDKDRLWIYPNLKNFDILIQPSRYEGFGLTIVEGMAACLPVIASNLDGPKEILCNGQFGQLFESENSEELVNKILKVIEQYGNGTIESKITDAYHHGVEYFSLPNMVKNYSQVYEQIPTWQQSKKIALF